VILNLIVNAAIHRDVVGKTAQKRNIKVQTRNARLARSASTTPVRYPDSVRAASSIFFHHKEIAKEPAGLPSPAPLWWIKRCTIHFERQREGTTFVIRFQRGKLLPQDGIRMKRSYSSTTKARFRRHPADALRRSERWISFAVEAKPRCKLRSGQLRHCDFRYEDPGMDAHALSHIRRFPSTAALCSRLFR